MSLHNRCARGDGNWDCPHQGTPYLHTSSARSAAPVPPSLSKSCQPAALHRTHLSTSVTAHTTHCSKEVPNTHVYLVLHTCLPSGHCALFDELLSTQRLHGPTTARCRCTFRPCPSLPISSSRFTRIGTEMTYSNTCDPARPPAESQRSITSQILIPRDKRQEREKKNAHAQLTNPLPL